MASQESKISNDLLFSRAHFDLLAGLYRMPLETFGSVEAIYGAINSATALGLDIERVGFWSIEQERLVCRNQFDHETAPFQDELTRSRYPNYFSALQNGIAIVADDARTNEFTSELAQAYLEPLRIQAMLDVPVRQNGQLCGILCCESRDKSRKWSEADLAFARTVADILTLLLEQWEHRTEQRELAALYDASKKLNEKLLDFTYIISHNIRSNTSNMAMLLDLIDDTKDVIERDELFHLLRESNAKLSETILYLNETINIQLGSKESRTKVKVKQVVENALSGINGILKNEHAQVDLDIPEALELKTIPSYFESILFNLITNAAKYRHPERVPHLVISAKKFDGKTEISVADNGRGIDLNRYGNKLFGMYKTFHGNPDAVGLGLFMTKNHVEALGGTITVESTPEVGSTFKITFA